VDARDHRRDRARRIPRRDHRDRAQIPAQAVLRSVPMDLFPSADGQRHRRGWRRASGMLVAAAILVVAPRIISPCRTISPAANSA
jgi:hypothetical protein